MGIIAALLLNIGMVFAQNPVIIEREIPDKYLTRRRWTEVLIKGHLEE
jgi:hypothetical protein